MMKEKKIGEMMPSLTLTIIIVILYQNGCNYMTP